jgi:hypothetical protein
MPVLNQGKKKGGSVFHFALSLLNQYVKKAKNKLRINLLFNNAKSPFSFNTPPNVIKRFIQNWHKQ